jgi:uncharacterized membrane protein YdjX (TVP38/TMEM64 family)
MTNLSWSTALRSPRVWIAVVLLAAGLALLYFQVDIEQVHAAAEKLPGWLCFLLLVGLPMVGFPASVLHVGAGLRFGTALGLALVWFSILLQLLASYGLVHWNHAFFARRFKAIRNKIPRGAHAPVSVFTMLIPGAPYFAQNYILPVIGVPLRLYLFIGFPIHSIRSTVAVIVGGQSHDLTPGRVLAMLVYGAGVLAVSWWALRRLKTALGDRSPAAGGRKQPA